MEPGRVADRGVREGHCVKKTLEEATLLVRTEVMGVALHKREIRACGNAPVHAEDRHESVKAEKCVRRVAHKVQDGCADCEY
jgi:hypothetical protein